MSTQLSALAQSESKASFCIRLKLDCRNPAHKQLYSTMKTEALAGRQYLTDGRDALMPDLREDESIQPPYSISQISETAMHQTIRAIYDNASETTKAYYDRAWNADESDQDNWIIRWMLWHVFRYRDKRNKHHKTYARDPPSPPLDKLIRPGSRFENVVPFVLTQEDDDNLTMKVPQVSARMFDPIRDI